MYELYDYEKKGNKDTPNFTNEVSESISRYLLNNEDPEELINFLSSENPEEIYNLQIGENQFTSKLNNI